VPDYTPVFLPGTKFTMQASGTIAGGDLLVVSGSGTVAKAAALAGLNYVGVAGHDAVSGAKVTVIAAKAVHESVADGAVTAGDLLTTTNTANRQVKTLAAAGAAYVQAEANASRGVIGIALTTAADNVTVRWMQR
jgi:hypothetical protein